MLPSCLLDFVSIINVFREHSEDLLRHFTRLFIFSNFSDSFSLLSYKTELH